MPIDRFELTQRTTAKLLIRNSYVSVRWVVNSSVWLKQSQARTNLRRLVAMGWMRERRVPSLGNCYFPTDIGRLGFASLVDEPLLAPDA